MLEYGAKWLKNIPLRNVLPEEANDVEEQMGKILKAKYPNFKVSVLVQNPIQTWASPPIQLDTDQSCDNSFYASAEQSRFPDHYPPYCFFGGSAFKLYIEYPELPLSIVAFYWPAAPQVLLNQPRWESVVTDIQREVQDICKPSDKIRLHLGSRCLLKILEAINTKIRPKPRATLLITDNTALPAEGMKSLLSFWLPWKLTNARVDEFNNRELCLMIWILLETTSQSSSDSQSHLPDQSHIAGQSHYDSHETSTSATQGVPRANTLPFRYIVSHALMQIPRDSPGYMMTAAQHIYENLMRTFTANFIQVLHGEAGYWFEDLHFLVFLWENTDEQHIFYLHKECKGTETLGDPPLHCYITGGATELHELLEGVTILVAYWRPSDVLPETAVELIGHQILIIFPETYNLFFQKNMVVFTSLVDFHSRGAELANLYFQGAQFSKKYNRVVFVLAVPLPFGVAANDGGPFLLNALRECLFIDAPSSQSLHLVVFVLPAGVS